MSPGITSACSPFNQELLTTHSTDAAEGAYNPQKIDATWAAKRSTVGRVCRVCAEQCPAPSLPPSSHGRWWCEGGCRGRARRPPSCLLGAMVAPLAPRMPRLLRHPRHHPGTTPQQAARRQPAHPPNAPLALTPPGPAARRADGCTCPTALEARELLSSPCLEEHTAAQLLLHYSLLPRSPCCPPPEFHDGVLLTD